MLHFEPFYNNWIDTSSLFVNRNYQSDSYSPITMTCDADFFNNLQFDQYSLRHYRLRNAELAAKQLGNKIALTLSGGVDSQAMVSSFVEAGIDVDIVTLVFNNDLNIQDVTSARNYCKEYGLKLIEIPLDIVRFLTFENYDYGIKYNSASPHFNTHYKLYNILKEQGYTGIASGGFPVVVNHGEYGTNFRKNELNYVQYSAIENIPVIGNYLSYTAELSWAICLCTPDRQAENNHMKLSMMHPTTVESNTKESYKSKIKGYQNVGFKIIPQETKYTGFELVKKYFENLTGDGWAFEKRFRHNLEKVLKPPYKSKLLIDDELQKLIVSIHSKNLATC